MAIAFNLVTQRPNLLTMAGIAALADVDVPAGEFKRRIRPHASYFLDRAVEPVERCNFHTAADRNNDQDTDDCLTSALTEQISGIT